MDPARTQAWRQWKGCKEYAAVLIMAEKEVRKHGTRVDGRPPQYRCLVCDWNSKKQLEDDAMGSFWGHLEAKSKNEEEAGDRSLMIHPTRAMMKQMNDIWNLNDKRKQESDLRLGGAGPDPAMMGSPTRAEGKGAAKGKQRRLQLRARGQARTPPSWGQGSRAGNVTGIKTGRE